MTQLAMRPVTATFGAEITGIDLADGVDDELLAALSSAVHEHQVVFLPGQTRLDDDGQFALMMRLGTASIPPRAARIAGLTATAMADHFPARREMARVAVGRSGHRLSRQP